MKLTIPPGVRLIESGSTGALFNSDTKAGVRLLADEMEMWKALRSAESIEAARSMLVLRSSGDGAALARRLGEFVAALLELGMLELNWGPFPGLRLLLWRSGSWATFKHAASELKERLGWWLDASFDRRFGTETTGFLPVSALHSTSRSADHAFYYVPTPARVLRYVLSRAIPDPERYVFIDFGSGKGRVLLLASHLPFRRIIGVEFSELLHAIAQRNIVTFRSDEQCCADVTSVCCDAVEFELPDDDLVLYFWTPFGGPVLSRVLERIEISFARRPRSLIIILYTAREDFIEPFRRLKCVTERMSIVPPRTGLGSARRRLRVFGNAKVGRGPADGDQSPSGHAATRRSR